ncbi:MAG: M20/M25/M40 family metallo-hydrolase [Acidobacteria bacterium]|nr:M20/M25/M40 family metallo-hydrolase [Acidobacteriota bacterium]
MRRLLFSLLAPALLAQSPAELRIRKDLQYLAAPERKGRGNGTPEIQQVADFLVNAYKGMGLKPQVQHYPFIRSVDRLEAEVAVGRGDTAGPPLVWGRDVEAYGFSADADFRHRALTFVGYGLQIHGHDDLQGLDLNRKVAIIVPRLPDKAPFSELDKLARSLPLRVKKLQQAGACAVIVLEDGASARRLQREDGPARLDLPVLSMPLGVLAPYCEGLQERVAKLKEEGKPQSRDYVYAPWTFLDLKLKLKPQEAPNPNVSAVIHGTDRALRGEFIALGAHMDHLGLGDRHSMGGEGARGQTHPGADDNASGTALLLELARQLKAAPLKRSVVLLHFSGEEEGLLGSGHWIQNPTVPKGSVKFMANFDMVGYLSREKPTLYLGALGAPKAELERARSLAPPGLNVSAEVGEMLGGSDHMTFSVARIPTFFFFTGVHPNYHKPSDTAERINTEGMATLADFARKIVLDLANGKTLPPFDPETAKFKTGKSSSMRVDFGVLPDYGENPKGFRIQGVRPGSTAESIGLQGGDVLTAFGEVSLKGIYDYMEALGRYKGGDKAVVKWLRGDKEMQAEATLKGRN